MRAFAGLALVSGTVSVVGFGSSCGAGDSGAVPVTVGISVSPEISMVNARVAGGKCAHLGGGVVVASSSRSLGTGRARGARWQKGMEVVSAGRIVGIIVGCVVRDISLELAPAYHLHVRSKVGEVGGGARLLESEMR